MHIIILHRTMSIQSPWLIVGGAHIKVELLLAIDKNF